MSKTVQARTRVRVTVEVSAGVYGADTTAEFMLRQAAREGADHVRMLLSADRTAVLLGEPEVTIVLVEEAR